MKLVPKPVSSRKLKNSAGLDTSGFSRPPGIASEWGYNRPTQLVATVWALVAKRFSKPPTCSSKTSIATCCSPRSCPWCRFLAETQRFIKPFNLPRTLPPLPAVQDVQQPHAICLPARYKPRLSRLANRKPYPQTLPPLPAVQNVQQPHAVRHEAGVRAR